MSTRVAHKAIQITGGYGYSKNIPSSGPYRDARITEITKAPAKFSGW